MKAKENRSIPNPDWVDAGEIHWVSSLPNFKCPCSICKNSKPLKAKRGKIGKVYFEKVT